MPPTPEQIELVRAHEPILYFESQERFLPCDPKRYLENSALWPARAPGTSLDDWGQEPAGVTPKTPVRRRRRVAALKDEATDERTWIGDLLDGIGTLGFLSMSGWTDEDASPGTYRVAELDDVFRRYREVEALRTSRPWYYAEILDSGALDALAQDPPPGLTAEQVETIIGLLDSPTLILYHLFYAGHEEPLGGCPGGDAEVFGSYGGDWACVAVLLEGGRPSYLGLTQRNVGTRDAADDSSRLGMVLTRWNNVSTVPNHPTHPRAVVARGTHSMYSDVSTQGERRPAAFTSALPDPGTGSCGEVEAVEGVVFPEPPPPAWKAPSGYEIAIKIWGVPIVGWVWAAIELSPPFGGPGSVVDSPTDVTPTLEDSGTVIAPVGVSPDADLLWPTDDGVAPGGVVMDDGRRYPFVIDRAEQAYWPSPGGGGFRGRWGPAVTSDPRGRRSGMRLPRFDHMFLDALARI